MVAIAPHWPFRNVRPPGGMSVGSRILGATHGDRVRATGAPGSQVRRGEQSKWRGTFIGPLPGGTLLVLSGPMRANWIIHCASAGTTSVPLRFCLSGRHACRVRLDHPSHFCGRDEHAPPNGHDKHAPPNGGWVYNTDLLLDHGVLGVQISGRPVCRACMPIRPREPNLYPDDLLSEPFERALGHRWWALYTKPRQEKALIRRLREMEIAHYCPLVPKRTRTPKGRKFTAYIPLFAGYVFLCGDEDARYRAMTTDCISQCLDVPDVPGLVRDLFYLKRLIDSNLPILPESKIGPGVRVRIRSGALAGIEGLIVSRHGEDRFIVTVSFIQRGASVLVDRLDVEAIEPSETGRSS
jgi:transcriptional antiterminator RfaH